MKSVVVASGKGGTGKTTMTAAFAHLAARRLRVTVADADVEASNLSLALHVRDVSCEAFRGGSKAVIDGDACTGCGLCAGVCRFDAITQDVSGTFRVDPLACEGCGRCAFVCELGAAVMTPSTAGEACKGDSIVGPAAFGQLGPGEDLSGKLVTEVRRLAADAAERHECDVLFIDGPPGIGCPLIAAVASADLLVAVAEPTVSGAHDLGRLADLAGRLHLPVRVLLNKADLSEDGAARIRQLCASRGLTLLAEVPFEPALGVLLEVMAEGAEGVSSDGTNGLREVAGAWATIARELGLEDDTRDLPRSRLNEAPMR
jgi:MinD superfamily P-loop ATPase